MCVRVRRLLSRHRQTGCSSVPLRLHGSLPPIFQPAFSFFLETRSLLLCCCFPHSFFPESFSGGRLQPILWQRSFCFLTRRACICVCERDRRREGGCCLSLSLSFYSLSGSSCRMACVPDTSASLPPVKLNSGHWINMSIITHSVT